ncbi:hypothetical protein [Alteriqipengyuania sp. 357]
MSAALFAAPVALHAQERSAVKEDFELGASSGQKILVLRPSVLAGAQSTGGIFEPNADWTEQARANLATSLTNWQTQLGNEVVPAPEAYGEDAILVEEYMALFRAIASSVIEYQFFVGNRLPTKKQDNRGNVFEWSMGPGVASIPGAADADYALFILTKDAYGSTGRKILQVLAAVGPGIGVKSGEHIGYAGLVDLRTGDLLWLNADGQMGGDVRDPEGSEKRMRQLLEDFPGSSIEAE